MWIWLKAAFVVGVTCEAILFELAEKLRQKLQFTDAEVARTLAEVLAFNELVRVTGHWES